MAYSATVTLTELDRVAGIRRFTLTIAETEAAQTSEKEIVLATVGLPPVGRIHSQLCKLTSGTGTTIDPILGNATSPATAMWKFENPAAAAQVHNQPDSAVKYGGITSFFHRAVVNSAVADHVITTTYYVSEGWD